MYSLYIYMNILYCYYTSSLLHTHIYIITWTISEHATVGPGRYQERRHGGRHAAGRHRLRHPSLGEAPWRWGKEKDLEVLRFLGKAWENLGLLNGFLWIVCGKLLDFCRFIKVKSARMAVYPGFTEEVWQMNHHKQGWIEHHEKHGGIYRQPMDWNWLKSSK